ncbi:hypothetical protein [Algoriphagus litoralis]|uniref:hypothetical protein n=1 Tax=Algoriphagus litoralis TaxID=2202829 RepID=UPI000DBA8F82|nr:hypothetical protein [Algoriphagus litoralis]
MKRNVSIVLLALLALAVVLSFKSRTENLKSKLENLTGTYADPMPYPYGEAWGKRKFTFDKGKWTLVFTLSLDPDMKLKVFEFRTFGNYKLQRKSAMLPDTYEAVFYEEKKFVTLKTTDENLIHAFGFCPCNLSLDVEKDISLNGCSAWQSVKQCPGDYDLLSMDKEGKLYFGERPGDNDMCSPQRRPSKLSPAVVKLN